MEQAISAWMHKLDGYPGWRKWKAKQISYTLSYDDPLAPHDLSDSFFKFSDDVERQHSLITSYLALQETIDALNECEFYFRRYPFRNLPVTRKNHITNCCEMYFSRFYELRERSKKFFDCLSECAPIDRTKVGNFIKSFDKIFAAELKERNLVHHHRRFDDVALARLFLTDVLVTSKKYHKQSHLSAYKKVVKFWVAHVRASARKMEGVLEAIAMIAVENCDFLSELAPPPSRG